MNTSFRNIPREAEIPINIVSRNAPTETLKRTYQWIAPGQYPIPPNPRVQREPDSHMLILQQGTCRLFELYSARKVAGEWTAKSAFIWNLRKNETLPPNVASAVAAGTPMAGGLLNKRDAQKREIKHALNFTLPYSQRRWVFPATHTDGQMLSSRFMPMGTRIRLKRSVKISHLPRQARVIATAMKRYGMILTDTSGQPDGDQYDGFEIQGDYSPHWNEEARRALYGLHLRDFEVVQHQGPISPLDYTTIHGDKHPRPMAIPNTP